MIEEVKGILEKKQELSLHNIILYQNLLTRYFIKMNKSICQFLKFFHHFTFLRSGYLHLKALTEKQFVCLGF